jgi:hypothetical protein
MVLVFHIFIISVTAVSPLFHLLFIGKNMSTNICYTDALFHLLENLLLTLVWENMFSDIHVDSTD